MKVKVGVKQGFWLCESLMRGAFCMTDNWDKSTQANNTHCFRLSYKYVIIWRHNDNTHAQLWHRWIKWFTIWEECNIQKYKWASVLTSYVHFIYTQWTKSHENNFLKMFYLWKENYIQLVKNTLLQRTIPTTLRNEFTTSIRIWSISVNIFFSDFLAAQVNIGFQFS